MRERAFGSSWSTCLRNRLQSIDDYGPPVESGLSTLETHRQRFSGWISVPLGRRAFNREILGMRDLSTKDTAPFLLSGIIPFIALLIFNCPALANTDELPSKSRPAAISWSQPEEWEEFGPISFRLQRLPQQEFILIFPEWLTALNMSVDTIRPTWTLKQTAADAAWSSAEYALKISLRLSESPQQLTLSWKYIFHNRSGKPVFELAAFHCLLLDRAPRFKDITLDRTWVRDHRGELVTLKTIGKTQGEGRRTMQFYPTAGGIDLDQQPTVARWEVNSNNHLSGDRIGVISKDGQWRVESIVDGPVAYFFNNWEHDHGCIHAAPLFGSISPGEKKMARGRITFSPIK